MSQKTAKKIRQTVREDQESRAKSEAWNFFSAVAVMTFQQRLMLAWTILFYKGEKPLTINKFKKDDDDNVPMSGVQTA